MKRSLLLYISFIVALTAPLWHGAEAAGPSGQGTARQEILILNTYHPGFEIPLPVLPEGSAVISKPVSFYVAHRVVIQTALGVIGFLLIVTSLLTIIIILRRRSAITLRASEAKYYDLYENAPDMYFSADAKTATVMECNNTLVHMIGYAKEEMLGRSIFEMYHPDCREEVKRLFQQFTATGEIRDAELKIMCKDGRIIDVSLNASAVRDKDGKIIHSRSIWRNITNRKKIEEALHRSEENFRRSLDDSPLGIRIVTIEGETIYANRAILDIVSIEELNTIPLVKRYTPESYAESQIRREKRKRGDSGPSEYEASIVKNDGEVRRLQVFRKEIFWNGERQFQVIYQDITERKRMEEALRESEERHRDLFARAIDGILILSVDGKLVDYNESFARMHGYSMQEMRSMSLKDLDTPETFQLVPERLRRVSAGESLIFEVEHYHKDRHVFPLEVSTSLIFSGKASYIQCFHRDITERKRMEVELAQSQKLTSLGIMAGGIAHEIRNPLAICSSAAQFLLDDEGMPTFRRECVEKIYSSIQRISTIIENMLKFAHPSSNTHIDRVNLVTLLKETMTLVNYHARSEKIETSMDFPADTIMVQGVATLLQQVFMNLFLNAINAMPDGGMLAVTAEVRDQKAHIRVCDTGRGIPQAHIDKIFDPFYTTSAIGKGTGLGLSICYSIVKQHSGTIAVKSIKGKGTTFTVRLPVNEMKGVSYE